MPRRGDRGACARPTRLEKISIGGALAIERRRKGIDERGKGCDGGAGWDLRRDLCETTRDRQVLDTKVLHRLCWKDCLTNETTTYIDVQQIHVKNRCFQEEDACETWNEAGEGWEGMCRIRWFDYIPRTMYHSFREKTQNLTHEQN